MAKIIIGNVKGRDGRGISKIMKTASTGVIDTYTITYTDGTTSTFTIRNSDEIMLQRQIVPSAAVESSTTASQAYTAGNYVVVGGVLRKVTASIAKGATINDSNSTATTVTKELAPKKIASGNISVLGATFSYDAYSEPGFVSIVYKRVNGYMLSTDKVNEEKYYSSVLLPSGYRPQSRVRISAYCSVCVTPYTETAIIEESGKVGLEISSAGAIESYGGFEMTCVRFKTA